MKMLYLADQDLDNESGVSQKICMQSKQWLAEGHQVTILSLQSLSFFSVDKQRLSPPLIKIKRVKWRIFIHLLYSSWKLKDILKDVDFDIVYMRYRLYAPFLKAALKKHPQIIEINTDDINEYRHSSPLLYWYNRVFRSLFLRSVDGFVCVSNELHDQFTTYNKPAVVIANGIKLDDLSFEPSTSTSRPSLVFIGSPNQRWHGLEKIIYMAQKLSEFDFHIVGLDGIDTQNLFYYGYLPTDDANAFVQKHDIGISTLSLYEKKMYEASPLKTRQYLAQGLPVIYAYKDTDFESENTFSLQLPNSQNNILASIEKIRAFVNTVYADKTTRKQAREFAKSRLDVTVKEKKRLSFFGEFL
ncbi:MAG: glycosyltransferase family 4 protein [Campylobacterota bacterium]